jgi:hypothetical protein
MVVVLVSIVYCQATQLVLQAQKEQGKRESFQRAREQARRKKLAAQQAKRETGVPCRTMKRWTRWWQGEFPRSRFYQEQQGRFVPGLAMFALPASLLERFEAEAADQPEALVRMLVFISPLSSGSGASGSRELRVQRRHAEEGVTVGKC